MFGLGRQGSAILAAFLLIVAAAGCKDDEPIRVRSLKFRGVSHISESELRTVLATKQGSWLPFSKKPGFNRDEFTRDLQRVTAFYTDRGYPDAKVTSVDADLDAAKQTVALTVTVAEGDPVIVESVRFDGFEALPERRQQTLPSRVARVRSAAQPPRGRAGRETAANDLREFGHPYAEVTVREDQIGLVESRSSTPPILVRPPSSDPSRSTATSPWATMSSCASSRSKKVSPIARAAYRARSGGSTALPLFQFAYVEPRGLEERAPQVPMRVTLTEDKHRQF